MRLALFGSFEITNGAGDTPRLPLGAQRLLAFLALQEGGMHRAAAERLWPNSHYRRASANLRSALWQIRRLGNSTLIDCLGPRIRLARAVRVDFPETLEKARRLTSPSSTDGDLTGYDEITALLSQELLPNWSDEWLLLERERWDQVRLHALETLAQRLMGAGKYLPALEAAFTAVAIEPVRESAHRTVLQVYIAEGNLACALKHYQRYRGLVYRELGVIPSRQMTRLVQPHV